MSLDSFITWHKKYIIWWQKKIGLSDYALLWLSFLKGVFLTVILMIFFF
jgi:hypothetical protein